MPPHPHVIKNLISLRRNQSQQATSQYDRNLRGIFADFFEVRQRMNVFENSREILTGRGTKFLTLNLGKLDEIVAIGLYKYM